MSREITTTVYTFDELSTEAQKRAVEDYRSEQDFPWLSDDLSNKLEELLAKHGITYEFTPNVYYSLSHSQGDGAMFEGTLFWKAWRVEVRHMGHYYHENSKTFWDFESVKTGKAVPDKTYHDFNQLYQNICIELRDYGYSIIEAETSDENISQYLTEMDYEFTAEGSRI